MFLRLRERLDRVAVGYHYQIPGTRFVPGMLFFPTSINQRMEPDRGGFTKTKQEKLEKPRHFLDSHRNHNARTNMFFFQTYLARSVAPFSLVLLCSPGART